jgi:hypothetical protein
MESRARIVVGMVIALLAVAGLSACGSSGGSSSESSSGSSASSGETSTTANEGGAEGFPASSEFVKFGKEASSEEREAASEVLEENLQARSSGDFEKQCETLSAAGVKVIAGNSGGAVVSPEKAIVACGKKLESESKSATAKQKLPNTLTGPIAVLRVEGNKGYALYHGTGGKNYAMPMVKEGDTWKAAALVEVEVTPATTEAKPPATGQAQSQQSSPEP